MYDNIEAIKWIYFHFNIVSTEFFHIYKMLYNMMKSIKYTQSFNNCKAKPLCIMKVSHLPSTC